MSIYDYLNCKVALPKYGLTDTEFQTHDTPGQFFDTYELRGDGSLWHEDYELIDDPEDHGRLGFLKKVNTRWVLLENFTGEIKFHGHIKESGGPGGPDGFVYYSSYFVKGMLKELHFLEEKFF